MPVNTHARAEEDTLSEPMSFRHLRSRREMLEAFMRADGLDSLTPILRDAVDHYIAERLRRGGEAMRSGAAVVHQQLEGARS